MIPGRTTSLASSWVFIAASVVLLIEFIALNAGPYQALYYTCGELSPGVDKPCEPASWVTNDLINALGAIEAVLWFVGFALLIDWLVFYTFPIWGASRRALAGATLKLIASVLFNVQPWSALVDKKYGLDGVGVPWSNFLGIVFFHSGNLVDCVGMTFLFDRRTPFAWANWPVWGIWTYTAATWFLVVADGSAYFAMPRIEADPALGVPLGCALIMGPPAASTDVNTKFVAPGQIIGASLLLLASIIFTAWGTFMPRAAVKDVQAPLVGGA